MRAELEEVCGVRGPDMHVDVGGVTDGSQTHCQRIKSHVTQGGFDIWHRWFNDEGNVTVRWKGEGPGFNYSSGSWREEA